MADNNGGSASTAAGNDHEMMRLDGASSDDEEMIADPLEEMAAVAMDMEAMLRRSPNSCPPKKKAKNNYQKVREKATKQFSSTQAYWTDESGSQVFAGKEGRDDALLELGAKELGMHAHNGLKWTTKSREDYNKTESLYREIMQCAFGHENGKACNYVIQVDRKEGGEAFEDTYSIRSGLVDVVP
jgi:hypothetical protein